MGRLPELSAVLAVVFSLSSSSVVKSPSDGTFELLILHNNDMHARFEQTSQLSGACTTADREAGKCYGGFPRVATVVKEARAAAASGQGPPVLYLNAGDTYTGTAWFTIYKWKVAAEFLNALQPDAVSLGNNELDGERKISPFLENLDAPILASNIIVHSNDYKAKIQKSLVKNVNGILVGIVGYLTPEDRTIYSSADIEYIDEVIALSEEVAKLQAQGVKIIIALGHSNMEKDMEIAREVDGIDLIIAGHKNSYYWNGADAEKYALTDKSLSVSVTITQKSGKRVPIIQSYAYNKNLGKINVRFDLNGDIIDYQNTPVCLDTSIPQDPETSQIVNKLVTDISSMSNTVVGNTAVVLDGESCSLEECNLGNLVTDSVMYYYAIRYQGERWTDAPVAVIHGGAIAASISPSNRPAGVTMNNLLTALPTKSTVVAVTMNGTVLLQMLEHSVADYRLNNPSGQFLHFSGIRVVYDLAKDQGSRIVSAVVRCWACSVPEFFSIDDWREYKILMPAELSNGQFGYTMLKGLPQENLVYDEVTCTSEFIRIRSPVYPEVSGRVVLLNLDSAPGSASKLNFSILILSLMSMLLLCV